MSRCVFIWAPTVKTKLRGDWGVCVFVVSAICFSLLASQSVLAVQNDEGKVVKQLTTFLEQNSNVDFDIEKLVQQDFATKGLTAEEANAARDLLVQHHRDWILQTRKQEMENLVVKIGEYKLPFWFKVYGEKPDGGRSLYISMHGGGGAPKRVNDQQWNNQKQLYEPVEGVYVAPRAPVDAWNMWHVAEVDDLFQQLIADMVAFHDVNPDRVYLMGYSAGGDGVYQIAPRWADHLAAAAMMAGHPNETTADGLRNLPFCLQMGGKDGAYDRNKIAARWKTTLEQLQKEDPDGYPHLVKIYPDYGHWMNREDAIAVPWMAKFNRNRFPDRIVWKQDDVTHKRFYWLTNEDENPVVKSRVVVDRKGQNFEIQSVEDVEKMGLLLDDQAGIDLDLPVVVSQLVDGELVKLEERILKRTIQNMAETLWQRGDPKMIAPARLTFEVKTQSEVDGNLEDKRSAEQN